MKLADNLGISEQITFHGRLDRDRVIQLFDTSDLHVITSRAEGNPTTLWEAMARNVPTITLDHCGMSDSVCKNCGILIDVENIIAATSEIAHHIHVLASDSSRLEKLKEGVSICRQKHLWSHRQTQWCELYSRAIDDIF
jgi:glycosyltransferase involved in cell wall biosynthesis